MRAVSMFTQAFVHLKLAFVTKSCKIERCTECQSPGTKQKWARSLSDRWGYQHSRNHHHYTLMLGRLRMDVDTAIKHYDNLVNRVFSDVEQLCWEITFLNKQSLFLLFFHACIM
jgi:hypothetical protein